MNKILYTFSFIAALIFSGCSDSDDGYQDLKNTVAFSAKSLTFSVEGSSKAITVTTNKPWTLSSDAAWCSLSTQKGDAGTTVVVVTTENMPESTYENRTATLTLTVEGVTSGNTFTITQTRFPYFKLSGDTVRLTNVGQDFTISLQENYDFNVSTTAWITRVIEPSVQGYVVDTTLTFNVGYNPGKGRVGRIIITNPAKTFADTIFVKQAGNFSLTFENYGTGTFIDQYYTTTGDVYSVQIMKAIEVETPAYYRVMAPYTEYLQEEGSTLEGFGYEIGTPSPYIQLWVNADGSVVFDNFNTGILHPSYGQIWGYLPSLFTSGDMKLCKLIDKTTIQLAPVMYLPEAEGGFGQSDWAESPILITLPVVAE